MFSLSRILLPLDFSERCFGAARYAEALAAQFHSDLYLVHVMEPFRYGAAGMEAGIAATGELLASIRHQAEQQLASFERETLNDASVHRVLLDGDPARRIADFCESERIDLVVMPTHGYGPFRRFILGSVTAKVLHDVHCPVLTGVHMEQAPSQASVNLRTIGCAVDLGPQSRGALCWAKDMAAAVEARLALVHAVPMIESRPGEYFDRELSGDIAKGAKLELGKLKAELDVEADDVIEAGDAPKAVCRAAERVKADLLVIARGSAAGVSGRLRTNAYAIIRGSPCPVVSV